MTRASCQGLRMRSSTSFHFISPASFAKLQLKSESQAHLVKLFSQLFAAQEPSPDSVEPSSNARQMFALLASFAKSILTQQQEHPPSKQPNDQLVR